MWLLRFDSFRSRADGIGDVKIISALKLNGWIGLPTYTWGHHIVEGWFNIKTLILSEQSDISIAQFRIDR